MIDIAFAPAISERIRSSGWSGGADWNEGVDSEGRCSAVSSPKPMAPRRTISSARSRKRFSSSALTAPACTASWIIGFNVPPPPIAATLPGKPFAASWISSMSNDFSLCTGNGDGRKRYIALFSRGIALTASSIDAAATFFVMCTWASMNGAAACSSAARAALARNKTQRAMQ